MKSSSNVNNHLQPPVSFCLIAISHRLVKIPTCAIDQKRCMRLAYHNAMLLGPIKHTVPTLCLSSEVKVLCIALHYQLNSLCYGFMSQSFILHFCSTVICLQRSLIIWSPSLGNKLVFLVSGFECRCGGLYCGLHRYSDKHDCQYDYKKEGEETIRKNNPLIVGSKVQKI